MFHLAEIVVQLDRSPKILPNCSIEVNNSYTADLLAWRNPKILRSDFFPLVKHNWTWK